MSTRCNFLRYIASKEHKEFLRDLKEVCRATSKEVVLALGEKWGVVIGSWQNKWEELSQYFQYAPAIRKLVYLTTRSIERKWISPL